VTYQALRPSISSVVTSSNCCTKPPPLSGWSISRLLSDDCLTIIPLARACGELRAAVENAILGSKSPSVGEHQGRVPEETGRTGHSFHRGESRASTGEKGVGVVRVPQQVWLDFTEWCDGTLARIRAQAKEFDDLKSLSGEEIYEWCELGREALNAYSDPAFAPKNLLRLFDGEARSGLEAEASPAQMRFTLICLYFLREAKSLDEAKEWVQEWAIRLFWGYRATQLLVATPYCEVLLIGLSETDDLKQAFWYSLYERAEKDIRTYREFWKTLSVSRGRGDAGRTAFTEEPIEAGDLRGIMDETLLGQVRKYLGNIEVPKLIENIVGGKTKRDIILPIKRDFIDEGRRILARRSHEVLYASPEDLAKGPSAEEILESERPRRIRAQLESWCKEQTNPDLQAVCELALEEYTKAQIAKETGLSPYMVNEYLKEFRKEVERITDPLE